MMILLIVIMVIVMMIMIGCDDYDRPVRMRHCRNGYMISSVQHISINSNLSNSPTQEWDTKSLKAIPAPPSSWRPFMPLDFVLRALSLQDTPQIFVNTK